MSPSERAVLAAAHTVAVEHDLMLVGAQLVDARGDPWSFGEFARATAARLAYSEDQERDEGGRFSEGGGGGGEGGASGSFDRGAWANGARDLGEQDIDRTATTIESRAQPVIGAVNGQPTAARTRALVARLSRMRSNIGTSLIGSAQSAYENALRHAGVKISTRARGRGSKAKQQQVQDAIDRGEPLAPLMPVVGIKESEAIEGAFDSFRLYATNTLRNWQRSQRDLLERARFDPDSFVRDGDVDAAVEHLVAGLVAQVRQSLQEGVARPSMLAAPRVRTKPPAAVQLLGERPARPAPPRAQATPPRAVQAGEARSRERVPARMVLDAMRVAEGRARSVPGETADLMPQIAEVVGAQRAEEAIASVTTGSLVYTWVHGYYGEPERPFEPHADLDGIETTDPNNDPAFANGEPWPDGDQLYPQDHDGCTCEWEITFPEA